MEETIESTNDLCKCCVERAKSESDHEVRQLVLIGETEKKKDKVKACSFCDGGLLENYLKNKE